MKSMLDISFALLGSCSCRFLISDMSCFGLSPTIATCCYCTHPTTFPTQHLVIAGSGDGDPWHSEVGPSHPIRTSVLIHHFQQAFDSQIAAPLSSIIQTNAKKPGTQHQNSSDGCSSFPYMIYIYIYIYPKSDPSLRWACSTVIYAKLLFMASNSSNSWAFADYSFLECHGSFLGILILSKRD